MIYLNINDTKVYKAFNNKINCHIEGYISNNPCLTDVKASYSGIYWSKINTNHILE